MADKNGKRKSADQYEYISTRITTELKQGAAHKTDGHNPAKRFYCLIWRCFP